MKALTLSQPWASAIALGYKQIETRKWHPRKDPGLLVIASSNTKMSAGQREIARLHVDPDADYPRRSLLAVVTIEAFVPTVEIRDTLDPVERDLGDYSDGRWAWRFGRVQPLLDPIELYPVPPKPGAKPRLPGALNIWTLPEPFASAVKKQIHPEIRRA